MKRLLISALVLIICARVTTAQRATASRVTPLDASAGTAVLVQDRRVQPLLGVGGPVAPAPPTDPALSVPLFDDQAAVQDIRIEINSKDWQALKDNYLANTYYPADFTWNGQIVRNVGIRSRGTASRSPTKPSLRIDFDRYTSGQRFLGLRSVNVKNNVTDPSSMHERISMHLFERLGFQVPRSASVRVLVNGVYDGIYTLVESPDKEFLGRVLGQNDGYFYKFDRNLGDDPYYFEYLGPDASLYVPHHWEPETHQSDPHPEPIIDMIRTIAEASDASFATDIGRYLDLPAVVRHVAVESYLEELDGILGDHGMNNFYAYRLENQTQHVLIPWDKSDTLQSGPQFNILHNIDDVPAAQQNRLWERVWRTPELRQLFYDTLLACAESAAALDPDDDRSWMEREIDRQFVQLRDFVAEDPRTPFSFDEFLTATTNLRLLARARPSFVRNEVEALRDQP